MIVEILDPGLVSIVYACFIRIEKLRFPSQVKRIFRVDIPLNLFLPCVVKGLTCALIFIIDALLES